MNFNQAQKLDDNLISTEIVKIKQIAAPVEVVKAFSEKEQEKFNDYLKIKELFIELQNAENEQ